MKTTLTMSINRIHFLSLIIPLLFWACGSPPGPNHGTEDGAQAHEHDNGLNIDTTVRQGAVELFVEYAPLINGQKSVFSAHFTNLEGHDPIKRGTVTVSLIKGKQGIRHRVDTPSSPGIFKPALLPKESGRYILRFDIRSPELDRDESIEWEEHVYSDEASVKRALSTRSSPEGAINFSKEQAWKISFRTGKVRRDTVYNTLKVPGRWMPAPKMERTMTAGAEGNVLYLASNLVEGRRCSRGEDVLLISGEAMNIRSIQSEIEKARAVYEQVKKEYRRKKELYELNVVPASEFEQIEKRYEIAASEYRQLVKNYSPGGVRIKAPFDGYIKKMHIDNGGFAEVGSPLFTLGSDRSEMIKVYIDPGDRSKIQQVQQIWIPYSKNGSSGLAKGKIVSIGQKVSRDEPLLSVFVQAESPGNGIEGSLAEVELAYGTGAGVPVVPLTSLLEDFGTYSVVVQVSGETYENRPVQIGARNGRMVAIEKGLKPGEWVVTEGAYQVKMASMKGSTPAHGHTH